MSDENKNKSDIVKTLKQFGFVKKGESGNQIYGVCPFCESPKFYVNEKKHMWDCKKCQREGGFYTFLSNIIDHCKDNLVPAGADKVIAHNRGLLPRTFISNNVGYNSVNETFVIPNYFHDNQDKVLNIGIYNGKSVLSTHGCKVGLYGWEKIKKSTKVIWLCEGVWDWLAMSEILASVKKKDDLAVGCPGAGTFKSEWGQFFEGKVVNVLYDNDQAGKLGAHKVHNNLIHYAKELHYVHWSGKGDGYDLRDFYAEHKGSAFKAIRSVRHLLQETPPEVVTKTGKELKVETRKDHKIEYTGKAVDHEKVYKEYKKWLHLPNTNIIDVIVGSVIANRLDGDPVWLFVVAPSGGTKTEMLLSISGADEIEVISSLTPRTLVSGMSLDGGVDPSLLPKLDGKVLIIKDFTAILSMNKTHRDEILGDLRDAYDGEFSKPFGNAKWRKYKSKFGIIAGVTPEIEKYLIDSIAMGERFLRYPIPIDNSINGRKGFIRRALSNVANETAMRESLQRIANKVLKAKYDEIPSIPDEIKEKIISLAHWVCMVRGVVSRDRYSKQITNSPFIEVGTRVAKQLCKVGIGIGMFKGKKELTDEEYETIIDIARGSVPRDYEMVYKFLFDRRDKEFTTTEIAEKMKLPTNLVDKIAQDFSMTGVLGKKKFGAISSKWFINTEVIELTEDSGIYEQQ